MKLRHHLKAENIFTKYFYGIWTLLITIIIYGIQDHFVPKWPCVFSFYFKCSCAGPGSHISNPDTKWPRSHINPSYWTAIALGLRSKHSFTSLEFYWTSCLASVFKYSLSAFNPSPDDNILNSTVCIDSWTIIITITQFAFQKN